MHKFTTGLIAGGLVTALGVSYAFSDKRSRRKMMKSGKKAALKAGHLFDDMF